MKRIEALLAVVAIALSPCAVAGTNAVPSQRHDPSKTNRVQGCTALNLAEAKWAMGAASNSLQQVSSKTNASIKDVTEARQKYDDAFRQYSKWNTYFRKHGHLHEWLKSTEDEEGEPSEAPLTSAPQVGTSEGAR